MPYDPDATPIEGIGALRLLVDQSRGNADETKEQCPRCDGRGEIEYRTESPTGYSIRWIECWLCLGLRMVSPRIAVEFRAWAGRLKPGS